MLKRVMELEATMQRQLEGLGVTTLYLFGSRAQGIARPDSDYDFGLLLKDPSLIREGSQELYQKIYDILQDLVQKHVNLDIVFLDRAPLQLRYHVIRYGQVLMNVEPLQLGGFIETTIREHADFEPHRQVFHEAILAQIP